MLIRNHVKTALFGAALLLPLCLALYTGLSSRLDRADFVFVNQGEVSSLDPAQATGIPEGRILMAISEGLTTLHPQTLQPMPACAESWQVSQDGKTIRFVLRPGLRWSNGQPLTAQDFHRSWKRLLDPATASPYAYLLWTVQGAKAYKAGQGDSNTSALGLEAPDPSTFVVRLEKRCAYFLTLTAFYPLFPVNADCIDRYGHQVWTHPENYVCNGPFRVLARFLKDRIRLEQNRFYWDAAGVGVRTVDALAVASPITALNLYLTGEVDWINQVPPIVLPSLKDRDDFSLTPNLGTNFLRFNVTVPPLNDQRVRRALHLAIDKQNLVEYVLKGGQQEATSFVPPGIPGYKPQHNPTFDPEQARALLAEAGFPQGKAFPQLQLLYSTDEINRDLAEVIALQLRKNLKIFVHPLAQERKGYFVSQNTLAYQICLCSWLGDYLDPTTFLDIFRTDSGNNRTGWAGNDYDTWLDRAGAASEAEQRALMLSNAEALLLQALPIAPLFFRTTANMIHSKWEGYYDNIQDVHPLKYIRRRES